MKYYAVTDDPNELVHWGVKGMKWGVRHDKPRHTGSRSRRPRSAAYKKAQAKLSSAMRNGIKRIETKWKAYNSPQAKEARFMNKAMQKARTGTLKYGKLTDAQVRRVTERLALERNARQLGSTENPRFGKRLKTAIGTGVVEGIGRGTASYINARFEGRGRTTAEIKRDKRMAKYDADQRVQQRKARNRVNQEYYEEAERRGYSAPLFDTQANKAKQLTAWKERDAKEAERQRRQNAYYDTYTRTAAANRAKNKVPDKSSSNNNNQNNNNQNNGNGQNAPKLPVSVNIYNGNGSVGSSPRSVNGHMIRTTNTRRRTRSGGNRN